MTDPPPIEYRDGKLDAPKQRRFVAELIGGIFAGVVAVIVCGAGWSMGNLHYNPQPRAWQTNQFEWAGPSVCTCVTLGLVAVLGWLAYRGGQRGLWMGMWIGAGVMLLVEGACFYNAWR